MSGILDAQAAADVHVAHDPALWAGVDRLLDRAPRDSDLRYHGLELLAARRLRQSGMELPLHYIAAERTAAATSLIAPLVLERVRAAADGPLVLMKGLEVAEHYANPLTRPYRDIDLLVEDAGATWTALRDAGFEPTGDPALYVGIHHLRPLVLPGLPLVVELHHEPKWIEDVAPPTADLLASAVPSLTGLAGISTLEPARHAVALAVHAWAHVPLSRLGRLLDVAAMLQGVDRTATRSIARSWGVERIWASTEAVVDGLFGGGRRPLAGRSWARHLWDVRERTVLERHLQCWLAPFWGAPPARAAGMTRRRVADQLTPGPGETRLQLLRRSAVAVRHALRRVSDHDADTARGSR